MAGCSVAPQFAAGEHLAAFVLHRDQLWSAPQVVGGGRNHQFGKHLLPRYLPSKGLL